MSEPTLRPLAELCSRALSLIDPKRDPEREFWYVDISAVDNVGKRIAKPQRVKGKDASVRARQLIQTHDVIVATTRPNLNAVALVPEQYNGEVCSTGFCVLRAGAELEPEYLFQLVQARIFIEPLVDLTKGALYPAVTDKQVFSQLVPWVPRANQRRIAARLKAQLAEVDTARQAAQVQVREAGLLRQRLLRQTFDALHDVPRKVLGEWAHTTSGSTPPRGDKRYWSPAEVPWVKTGEVAFAPITATEEAISRQALAECSLTLLPPQSVLIAMIGQGKTRGQSAILQIEAVTNQNCFAILPNDSWDATFLYHWLMASYKDLRELSASRGGSQSALNGALLNALEIPAPDIDTQRHLVSRLQAKLAQADAIAHAAAAQLAEIERLPQRLLAQAFNSHGAVK